MMTRISTPPEILDEGFALVDLDDGLAPVRMELDRDIPDRADQLKALDGQLKIWSSSQ